MEIKRVKNPEDISGGCVDTVLGTIQCPICKQQMFVEVATVGDPKETAWFIYHEKLGSGYCPGSEIVVSKLRVMKKIIIGIQELGFVIIDIINHDPVGKKQKIIAYLPEKACYIDVNFKDSELVNAEVVGQLQKYTLVKSSEFVDDWASFYMACSTTRISENCIPVVAQGRFTLSTTDKLSATEWLSAISQFLGSYRDDIAEYFFCSQISCLFARHCLCGDTKSSYDKETAIAINKSIASRFPSTMFADGVKKVTGS